MILLSGATGLLGSHIALELLKRGKKLRAIKRKNSSTKAMEKIFTYYAKENKENYLNQIQWVEADITDIDSLEEAFKDIKEVYHTAAKVSFKKKDRQSLYKINVGGTINMLTQALANKIDKFCHISSVAVFNNKNPLIKESFYYSFNKEDEHSYKHTKYLSELEVWRAHAEGLNMVIVNPSVVLAPGFWNQGSGTLLRYIQKNGFFYTKGTTGYVDARDVAFCSVDLMDKNHLNDHYIIHSENLSYKEIINHIREKLNLRPAIKINKGFLKFISCIWTFIGFISRKENPLSSRLIKTITSDHFYSNKKILRTLNHTFIPIKKALNEHIDKYRKEHI